MGKPLGSRVAAWSKLKPASVGVILRDSYEDAGLLLESRRSARVAAAAGAECPAWRVGVSLGIGRVVQEIPRAGERSRCWAWTCRGSVGVLRAVDAVR